MIAPVVGERVMSGSSLDENRCQSTDRVAEQGHASSLISLGGGSCHENKQLATLSNPGAKPKAMRMLHSRQAFPFSCLAAHDARRTRHGERSGDDSRIYRPSLRRCHGKMIPFDNTSHATSGRASVAIAKPATANQHARRHQTRRREKGTAVPAWRWPPVIAVARCCRTEGLWIRRAESDGPCPPG